MSAAKRPVPTLLAPLFLSLTPPFVLAQAPNRAVALEAAVDPSPGVNVGFVTAVSLKGDTCALGDPTGGPAARGLVHLFERGGVDWSQTAALSAGGLDTSLGTAVDFEGDHVVAAASAGFLDEIVVVAFERTGGQWNQSLRDTIPGSCQFAFPAEAVSISGSRFAVGAGFEDDTSDRGRVQVYEYDAPSSQWILQQTILAFDAQDGDLFGRAVSLDGDRLAVGGGSDVYVYERVGSSFALSQQLSAPAGSGLPHTLAYALELSGDRLVVGHWGDDDHGPRSGSAYVYDHDGSQFQFTAELSASDASADDRFGYDVSVDGDTIAVASRYAGTTYLFDWDGTSWTETAKICSSPLSFAVDLDGERLVDASPGASSVGGAPHPAAVYRFETPIGTSYCVAGVNSLGLQAEIQVLGDPQAANDEVFMTVRDAAPGQFGIFFYGTGATQVPFQGGFRCVTNLTRVNPAAFAECGSTSLRLSMTSGSALNDITLQVPIRIYFQFWYRDGAALSNLSDAVFVDFQ